MSQSAYSSLQLYVNSEKVGHAIFPLQRPRYDAASNDLGAWLEGPSLDPVDPAQPGWNTQVALRAPVLMLGCHRTAADAAFRDYADYAVRRYDEVNIWVRRLEVNRTHDETLYFNGGYCEQ